jgi:drug/metabolite transporter (DMT)-like permease
MAITFALLCALTYGAGDFCGGLSARRLHPLTVGWIVQGIVIIPTAIVALVVGKPVITTHEAVWAIVGGTIGSVGLMLLYVAMARAPMTLVAPTTALIAAASPVVFGVFNNERPSSPQWIGIVIALVAIAVISSGDAMPGQQTFNKGALTAAIGAGLGFGVFFIALDQSGDESGLWPLVLSKIGGAVFFSAILICVPAIRRRAFAVAIRPALGIVALGGFLDVAANSFYLVAVRNGMLSIVAVISSLYPASTVFLANRILKEKIVPTQLAGMLLAVCAIVLVAAG